MFEDEYIEARKDWLYNKLNTVDKETIIGLILTYSSGNYLESLTDAIKAGLLDV